MDSLARYRVSRGGRSRAVRLVRITERNTAVIEFDDQTLEVAFRHDLASKGLTSLRVGRTSYAVTVHPNHRSMVFNVEVDGHPFLLQLQAEPKTVSRSSGPTASSAPLPKRRQATAPQSGAVTSLMPGKVVRLKVKAGDKVHAGDPLCVLEAMKMENEVVAPVGGTITEVRVASGSTVDKGDLLAVIEP